MPFVSYAQRTYLKKRKPKIYKKWVRKYGTKVKGNKKRVGRRKS